MPRIATAAPEASTDGAMTAPGATSGALPSVLTVSDAAASVNRLAQDLFGKLANTTPSFFYSPASLQIALTMAYAGARGDTAAQMARTLHLPPDAAVGTAFASLLSGLDVAAAPQGGRASVPELSIANRLYGQKAFPFVPGFLAVQADVYKAPLETIDFAISNPERRINDWVGEKTHGKIAELIPPRALTTLTRLVLVNAIYFKGAWLTPFRPQATKTEPFFGKAGTVATALMHGSVHAPYAETKDAQVLELPYTGDRLVLDVVLPKTKDGIGALRGAIAAEGLARFAEDLRTRAVDVVLPRFKIKTHFEASRVLSELGMAVAFGDSADFRGMTIAEELHIDAVFHEAFVELNEEGTEAAAATGTVMAARALRIEPPPVVFRADHTFVFFVRDKVSGAILFAGQMGDGA